jgi:Tol biopolymer transport system component
VRVPRPTAVRAPALGLAALSLSLPVALLAPTPAFAELGPIELVSKSATEQADAAAGPALSADGRYLAFRATINGVSGVFRRDLGSGELREVAGAAEIGPGADAGAPSTSADGRYVSFTTRAQLDPADDTESSSLDVYVADMNVLPPTYELASARDASTLAIGGDSVASPRVALDAAGRRLVFVSGRQVYLRDLDTRATTLVSVARDPLSGQMEPGVPVPGGAVVEVPEMAGSTGAALSADGTTVAWLGAHLPAQVPLLSDERQTIEELDSVASTPYDEPLWRRVADGSGAPTRRIVGGGDPLAPGCPAGGTLADPACRGPFPEIDAKGAAGNLAMGWLGTQGPLDGVPALSADGRYVALIGNPTEATNVFLVDMAGGLSRAQALRQLTRQVAVKPGEEGGVVNREPFVPLNGHIWDLAISANGRRVAFATARQRFPLSPPNLITAPPSQLGLVELYLLDLETESLRRVTHGEGGAEEASLGPGAGANGDGASAPSLDADGHLIAFASQAANLVAGDGNDAGDVFLVRDGEGARAGAGFSISPPPRQRRAARGRRLALSAFSLPDGDVKLIAVVPVVGRLRARALASLAVGARPRSLAVARRKARSGGAVAMILRLPRRYRRLARSREGIYATAHVNFRGEKGKRLRGTVQVRFRIHAGKRGRR